MGNTIPNVEFKWKVIPGSATVQDLPLQSGILSVGRGSTRLVEIPLYRDLDNEPTEFFMIEIYQVVGGDAGVSSRSEQLNIVNLTAPTVSIPSITLKEGRTHHAFVSLSYAPDVVSNLRVYSTDSTASAPYDFDHIETVLQFQPGSTSGLFLVKVNSDTDNDEGLEEFYVRASSFERELGWGKIGIRQFDPFRTFSVPENSPIGTIVGSVAASDYNNYAINSIHFSIDSSGILTVKDSQFLDYEPVGLRVKREDVFAYEADGSIDVYKVTVLVTNVNERPVLLDQGPKFEINALMALPLMFKDPESDDIVFDTSVGGVLEGTQTNAGTQALWFRKGVTTENAINSTVYTTIDASDGQLFSDTANLEISFKQSSTSRFLIGTQRPTYAEDEPGATGRMVDVEDPSAGHGSETRTTYDNLLIQGISRIKPLFSQTPEAEAAFNRFEANTGNPYTLEVDKILRKSSEARSNWTKGMEDLISYLESCSFEGTVDLVDRVGHLGGTGDSDYGAAVGQYSGWTSARVTSQFINGTFRYTVEYRYHIWDPYDWNPFKTITSGNSLTNQAAEVFARMHMIGHFKQYLTQGVHTTTISWQKGNPPPVPQP